ncbi:MAG: type VI secretion system-associated protein TagF [Azoarcus sp.]|jgi:type VI secretion system protein ImpM|nr:type VI secretion system-associated protein TagF [Azoarcus sp.]
MPIAFMPSRDAAPRYAVFGKLPQRADFVRIDGGGHPVVQAFDDLLARSLAFASRQPDWDEKHILSQGPCDFQLTSDDGRECFTGVLHPSRDKTGRIFPLVAGVILPAQAIVPHSPELTIANELFFSGLREQLASAVDHAVDLIACRQFLDTWTVANPHARDDIELASQILARHLKQTSASRWHVALMDAGLGGLDDCLLAHIFQDSAAAWRAVAPALLPLSGTQGEDTLDQAAWLALYRAASGRGAHAPDYLCAMRDGRRYLAILPTRSSGEYGLAALWGVQPGLPAEGDDIPPHPAQADAAWTLARQLQNPALDLAALVEILARIARELADKPSRSSPFNFSFTH